MASTSNKYMVPAKSRSERSTPEKSLQHYQAGQNQSQFNKFYKNVLKKNLTLRERFKNNIKKIKKNEFWVKAASTKLPIIRWLKKYKLKMFLKDIVAGITVASINIPQAIAFGLLTGLPARYGFYATIYGAILYTFFGTSYYVSIGTSAPLSLILEELTTKVLAPANMTANEGSPEWEELNEVWNQRKVVTVMGITLAAGILQMVLGLCRFGFISDYFSKPLISGFTFGAAFHIATSQMKHVLGVHIPTITGPLNIFSNWFHLAKEIPNINICTILMSIAFMGTLSLGKMLNSKYKAKLKFPIPIDLIVLILSILLVYLADLNKRFDVIILGDIPQGLPAPMLVTLPGFGAKIDDYMPPQEAYLNAVILAILAFAVTLAMGKTVGARHPENVIDANQEMLALGITNTVSPFFSGYITAAAASRSLLQEDVGGQTQITGIVSAGLIVAALYVAAPLIYYLPYSVLACVTMVALRSLFLKILDAKRLYVYSRVDVIIWFVTALSVLLLGISMGFALGITVALMSIIAQSQSANSSLLGRIPNSAIYKNVKRYERCGLIPGICVFRINMPLTFLNAERFSNTFYHMTNIRLAQALRENRNHANGSNIMTEDLKESQTQNTLEVKLPDLELPTIDKIIRNSNKSLEFGLERSADQKKMDPLKIHTVIFDCEAVIFIDSMGISTLFKLRDKLAEIGIEVVYAQANDKIMRQMMLAPSNFTLDDQLFYPSVHDAVLFALKFNDYELYRKMMKSKPL